MSKKKKDEVEKDKREVTEEAEPAEETAAEEKADAAEKKEEKSDEVTELKKKRDEQEDSYLRLRAEYANYRTRTANEKLSLYDDATAKAVTELLPVADSVRMAIENLKDADPEIVKGVELISNQLEKSFDKLKISSYGAVGDDFDPNLHNAVSMIDNEELGSGKIAQVFQTGYKIKDKIIRHAMVQVTN